MEKTRHLTYRLLLALGLLLLLNDAFTQSQHKPGEFIVWLKDEIKPTVFVQTISTYKNLKTGKATLKHIRLKNTLASQLNIVLLEGVDEQDEKGVLGFLENHPDVLFAQYNHIVSLRATEDSILQDPRFGQQWGLDNTGQSGGTIDADIDAPLAWELAQGDASACGDTIVVAVIDEGADLSHEDLSPWTNFGEIPDNSIDDDGDGYIDNYQGWDAFTQRGNNLPVKSHGTSVSGVATAIGNNNVGISGVAWQSRLMSVVGSTNDEATVVSAFNYVLAQKRLYLSSNGKAGAFVVVANCSFGVDAGDPANFPIWCAMIDTMGAAGILTVASASNKRIDIDQVNDIPTSCSSDYLISVTVTNRLDRLHGNTSFGKTTVDLGAPGIDILSTLPNNRYGFTSGTSLATPHVSGTVALLMDYASEAFLSLYDNYPDSAASALKEIILQSVDPLPSLQDSVVSGGRLNAANAISVMDTYQQSLPDCYAPYRLAAIPLTDTSVRFSWKGPLVDSFQIEFRGNGGSWQSNISRSNNLTINGLQGCLEYEWRLASWCNGQMGSYSDIRKVQTLGCCIAPEVLPGPGFLGQDITLSWKSVFGITYYSFRYQLEDSIWNTLVVSDTFAVIPNLPPCQRLFYQLASQCDTGMSVWGPIQETNTPGCGACLNKEFCEALTTSPGGDWIKRFTIGPLDNESGNNFGYESFADAAVRLNRGERYAIRLEPGFAGSPFEEYWRIWLDGNQNGRFDDPGELIYDSGMAIDTTINDSIMIPLTAWGGPSRLRVRMRFFSAASACGTITFGETEDYCIAVDDFVKTEIPIDNALTINVFPQPASGILNVQSSVSVAGLALFDIQGRSVRFWDEEGKKVQLSIQTIPA
ncbi:MAG: S8 family serine peptidase, partial [Bacteroidia bacterium]